MVSPSIIKTTIAIAAPTAIVTWIAQALPVDANTLHELVRHIPVAIAMIIVVWMFLRHIDTRDERLGRAIDRLTDSIDKLEVRHDSHCSEK